MKYFVSLVIKAITLLLLFECFADKGEARKLEESKVYGWEITARYDNKTGQFSSCTAVPPLEHYMNSNGIIFIIQIYKTVGLRISFENPSWRLQPGERYPISYQIDDSPVFTTEAVALSSKGASFLSENASLAFDLIRKGREMKIQSAEGAFTVLLTNSSKALEATLECVRRHIGKTLTQSLFVESDTAQIQPTANKSQLQAEAAAVTTKILASSGISDFRLADIIPPEWGIFHAMWWLNGVSGVGEVSGATMIFEGDTVDSAVADLGAIDSQNCAGSFASMKIPSSEENAARLKTVCERVDRTIRIWYAVVKKREKGGVYIFRMAASGQETPANALDEVGARFYDATVQLVR